MATHLSILAWRIPMDRGDWQGCSPWGHKESVMAERLSTAQKINRIVFTCSLKFFL